MPVLRRSVLRAFPCETKKRVKISVCTSPHAKSGETGRVLTPLVELSKERLLFFGSPEAWLDFLTAEASVLRGVFVASSKASILLYMSVNPGKRL